jgi:hypothetical protein
MNADQVTSAMMQYNRKWILDQMRSGRPILDIGRAIFKGQVKNDFHIGTQVGAATNTGVNLIKSPFISK